MESTRLEINIPGRILEESDGNRFAERVRDVLEVYLNHEDSEFPFERLVEGNGIVDRRNVIKIENVEIHFVDDGTALVANLEFFLQQMAGQNAKVNPLRATRRVTFLIDRGTGAVKFRV